MVDQVRQQLMRLLSNKLPNDNYLDQLYSKYSELLSAEKIENPKLKNPKLNLMSDVLDSIKFEEFLWLVTKNSSRYALDMLLDKLYTCEKDEYGPNHIAIANLISYEKCKACFTTNFDNTIENACKEEAGINLIVYDETGIYPNKLPRKGETPILIKMHGSSITKNCVAESPVLLAAQSQETHKPLIDLLYNQHILVLGYSGLGDVDISPILSKTDAVFFWASHEIPNPDKVPDWVNYIVLLDLSHPRSSSSKYQNLLIEIAGSASALKKTYKEHEKPESIIEKWLKIINLDAKKLIISVLEWKQSDALLHLYHEELNGDLISRCRNYGWTCIQHRAYKTASNIFDHALKNSTGLDIVDNFHLRLGKCFADWRMGKWEKSRFCLEKLADEATKQFSLKINIIDQKTVDLLSDIYRNYLEISRDILQFLPKNKRSKSAHEWKLNSAIYLLENLPQSSPENKILTKLVEYNINWLLGNHISSEKIQKLFETSINLNYPSAAWAIYSLMLQMSILKSLNFYKILKKKINDARLTHYIGKLIESIILSILILITPPLGKLFIKEIIKLSYHLRTLFGEIKYRRQVKKWCKWRHDWIIFGDIQAEGKLKIKI